MLVLLLVYHGCSMQPGRSGFGITTLSPNTCKNWINNVHALTSCYEYFAPRKISTIWYIICVLHGRENHWDLLGDWCGQRILKGFLTICQPVLVLPHSTQKLLNLPYHLMMKIVPQAEWKMRLWAPGYDTCGQVGWMWHTNWVWYWKQWGY